MTWPYSTLDEVSHLAMEDAVILRARIDQLLEERREAWGREPDDVFAVERQWGLTPMEERLLRALVARPGGQTVSKAHLHAAMSPEDEPETEVKLVDVIACKLRRKLLLAGLGDDVVMTDWGRGLYLSPDGRRKLLERDSAV